MGSMTDPSVARMAANNSGLAFPVVTRPEGRGIANSPGLIPVLPGLCGRSKQFGLWMHGIRTAPDRGAQPLCCLAVN